MNNNVVIDRASGIPLVGSIAFGILDRGSSLVQVRPSTACNMRCTFCSTSANDFQAHPVNYVVEPEYLLDWVKEIAAFKGKLHLNIDSVGEPMTYPHLEYFIREARKIKEVYFISMQTNGTLLTEENIKSLADAGLNRINLSVHSLNPTLSKRLFGNENYSIERVLKMINALKGSTIEVLLAPVWLPKFNDKDIEKLIEFAKMQEIGVAIQKYEAYTYSRKEKNAKRITYYHFYKQLKEWEKQFGVRLVYNAESLQVHKAPTLPSIFEVGERLSLIVRAPGWMKDQMLGTAKNRCVTIVDCDSRVGDRVNAEIIENKHNIYLARMVKNVLIRSFYCFY